MRPVGHGTVAPDYEEFPPGKLFRLGPNLHQFDSSVAPAECPFGIGGWRLIALDLLGLRGVKVTGLDERADCASVVEGKSEASRERRARPYREPISQPI